MVRHAKHPELPERLSYRDSADDLPDDRPNPTRRRPPKRDPLFAGPSADPTRPVMKSLSFQLPIEDWKLLRLLAAQQHMTMTHLVREWLEPQLALLRSSDS